MGKSIKKIILIFLVSFMLFASSFSKLSLRADEVVIEDEVVEESESEEEVVENVEELEEPSENEELNELEEEKSEIAIWWDEEVMPHIFTFVFSAGGSSFVAGVIWWIVKKALKESKEKLRLQIEANAKSEKEYQERIKQLEEYNKLLEESLKKAIDTTMNIYQEKLDEAIAKLDLQAEEYQATKEKGEKLGKKLLEVFGDKVVETNNNTETK